MGNIIKILCCKCESQLVYYLISPKDIHEYKKFKLREDFISSTHVYP